MSSLIQVSPSWPGFQRISRLFVFGDSYSAIDVDTPAPGADLPLGIKFPGFPFNEPGLPNWVGHLITTYAPGPRYNPDADEQDAAYTDHPLLVYDYAVGGSEVSDVASQIEDEFLPIVGEKPDWALWTAEDSLFVTWVGINDCASTASHFSNIEQLFEGQQMLYDAGARNFLLVDVPPISRSAAGIMAGIPPTSYNNWNLALSDRLQEFSASHPDCTFLLYSSEATFNNILDNPQKFGFKEDDVSRAHGPVWYDLLHPTSEIHRQVAKDMAHFLSGVEPTPRVPREQTSNEDVAAEKGLLTPP